MFWRTLTRSISFLGYPQLTKLCLQLVLVSQCYSLTAIGNDELLRDSSPGSWQEDAELTDVFFLNPKMGWAVGAQGTILRTTNGGQDWLELGQAVADQVAPEMGLQQKIRAMQQGRRTQLTGVANGSSDEVQPYRCRFESVFFIDEQNGWVAGGYNVPYLNHTRGIILRTADGGVTWRQVRGALLPSIKRIRFTDRTHGWAAGNRGNLLPGSLFFTTDGGETWSNQPIQKERLGPFDCLDADTTEHGFVAIDTKGQPIVVKNGQVEPAVFEGGTLTRLNRLRMIDRRVGWCVGDAGALWRTQNGGVSWSPLTADSSSPIVQQLQAFDWHALAASPSKIWFAGNPGSLLFSIDRETGAVLSYSTGVSAPVKSLYFVDNDNGWLVGSLGTILATTDGGQTWQRQRGHQRGVAVLGLSFDEAELPLEALAMYSNEENLLMAVATCQGSLNGSAVQSVERLGGVGLFSIAPCNGLAPAGKHQEAQLERLVRLIRTLRPNVLISNSEYRKQTGVGGKSGIAFDPYLLVSTAVKAAGNRDAYPQQLEISKLQPWTVDRVAYRAPAGEMSLDPKRMLLRLGCPIEDRIGISRALLMLPMEAGEKRSYYVESGSGTRLTSSSNLFDGLVSGANGAIPKRSSDVRLRTNRASIELANRKHEKIAEMAQFIANTEQDLVVWNQKIQVWLAPIDESLAGIWLTQLAERYLELGRIELCAKSLEYLVQRYQGHALRLASLTWLVNYYSSDEFGRLELANLSQFRQTIAQSDGGQSQGPLVGRPTSQAHSSHQDGQTILVWAPVSETIELPKRAGREGLSESTGQLVVPEASASGELPDASQPDAVAEADALAEAKQGFSQDEIQTFFQSRWRRASSFMSQLNHVDPDLVNQLPFRYLEANLKRKLGGKSLAKSVLKRIEAAKEHTKGLSSAAHAELMLNENEQAVELPEDTIRASHTSERPHLDGLLDDPVWRAIQASQRELKQTLYENSGRLPGWSDEAPQTKQDVLMFAHDHQFLYLAIRCNKLAGEFYQMSPDSRPRDPDLNRRDRVELYFDVDRDFQSAYKFTVDYRGWGAEELNGAVGWNPQWYIARSEDEVSWTIEMAIPLETFSEAIRSGGETGSKLIQHTTVTAVPEPVSLMEKEIWSLRLARVTTTGNSWDMPAKELEKSELSKGLYQQILMDPAKFRFFAFQ